MRFLIGWDSEAEAELLSLYLNIDGSEASVTTDPRELLAKLQECQWDAVLLCVTFAREPDAFEVFEQIRQTQPNCPIVGACRPTEVFQLPRYLTHGMRSYLVRDASGDFVFLARATLENTVEAARAEQERNISDRLREEVESVRKLQQSIIPRELWCPTGYQACARYEPSQIRVVGGRPVVMAGGDYYYCFATDESTLVLLVGDASGHGMRACMSIMSMHTLVRMLHDRSYQDPAAFVREVNQRLCEQATLGDEGFITLFYGVLDGRTHELRWSAAGHPLPLMQELDTGNIPAIGDGEDSDLPLGVLPDAEYRSFKIAVPPRNRLVLYTDGLLDALSSETRVQAYGLEGVTATLRRTANRPLPEALGALFDESHAYTQGVGRHDDTSVMLLERE